ncbi:MAG: transcriptional regulator, partial [Fusobacterium nucleatum]|nr:transcriptional regulator [Fusobacterium nucleatum]
MKTTKTVNSCDCDSVNQELVDKVKKKFPDD